MFTMKQINAPIYISFVIFFGSSTLAQHDKPTREFRKSFVAKFTPISTLRAPSAESNSSHFLLLIMEFFLSWSAAFCVLIRKDASVILMKVELAVWDHFTVLPRKNLPPQTKLVMLMQEVLLSRHNDHIGKPCNISGYSGDTLTSKRRNFAVMPIWGPGFEVSLDFYLTEIKTNGICCKGCRSRAYSSIFLMRSTVFADYFITGDGVPGVYLNPTGLLCVTFPLNGQLHQGTCGQKTVEIKTWYTLVISSVMEGSQVHST